MLISSCFIFIVSASNGTPQCESVGYSGYPVCTSWLINSVNTSVYFDNSLMSVQNASIININGDMYMQINCTGIPQYDHVITSSDVNWLNSRPKASSDFTKGATIRMTSISFFGRQYFVEMERLFSIFLAGFVRMVSDCAACKRRLRRNNRYVWREGYKHPTFVPPEGGTVEKIYICRSCYDKSKPTQTAPLTPTLQKDPIVVGYV